MSLKIELMSGNWMSSAEQKILFWIIRYWVSMQKLPTIRR